MEEKEKKQKIKEVNKNKDFNIIVSYATNGKSFQSIAENIVLRKLDEV